MKDSLLIPLRLGMCFLLCLFLISSVLFLYYYVMEYSFTEGLNTNLISVRIVTAVILSMVPAVLLALFAVYFLILRHPGRQIPSFIMLFLSLYLLFQGTRVLFDTYGDRTSPGIFPPLHEKTILHYSQNSVYVTNVDGADVTGIVLLRQKSDIPKISTYSSGYIVKETGMLQLDDTTLILSPSNPGISDVMHIPRFLSNLNRDIQNFKHFLYKSNTHIIIFTLFFCSLWIVSRMNPWPLFNLLLTLFAMRSSLFFVYLVRTPLVQRIFAAWNIGDDAFIQIFFACTTGFLILWDILFVPYPSSKMEKKPER